MVPLKADVPLPIVGPARVVDATAVALRRAILAGELKPGQKLSIPALALRMGVSRSPVREAVLALTAAGLAVEIPRRGVVVTDLGPKETDAIHEARGPLEGFAARLAAERGPADLGGRLDAILAEQAEAVATADEIGYFRTNTAFHAAIAAACDNAEICRLLASLEGRMALALLRVAARPGHRESAVAEHRAVVDAIKARDGNAAEAAMRAHVSATRQRAK
ncbi:GntR family transcriptional regulator [Falsiroseomonas stagni]|uniref:DNA-binding transcriptional regulator, GntR family n=1 Tax=Falsiroseomonas stagni DSM 19981 TaxID=1123062 RepID=A0A1I4FAZ3_9PROT|nr:GntR family transcriptional regulator [Falsiroseomonas stagni]SFL14643.1 DNA-binding transcriptional regulator, GntR family [Falsiroseomonas stagni DSM 19981]